MASIAKLVRDNIIARIKEKGEQANYWQAPETELRNKWSPEKVFEEAGELLEAVKKNLDRSKIVGEAADLEEALNKFLELHRISPLELMEAQIEKRKREGSFDGGWILEIEEGAA